MGNIWTKLHDPLTIAISIIGWEDAIKLLIVCKEIQSIVEDSKFKIDLTYETKLHMTAHGLQKWMSKCDCLLVKFFSYLDCVEFNHKFAEADISCLHLKQLKHLRIHWYHDVSGRYPHFMYQLLMYVQPHLQTLEILGGMNPCNGLFCIFKQLGAFSQIHTLVIDSLWHVDANDSILFPNVTSVICWHCCCSHYDADLGHNPYFVWDNLKSIQWGNEYEYWINFIRGMSYQWLPPLMELVLVDGIDILQLCRLLNTHVFATQVTVLLCIEDDREWQCEQKCHHLKCDVFQISIAYQNLCGRICKHDHSCTHRCQCVNDTLLFLQQV